MIQIALVHLHCFVIICFVADDDTKKAFATQFAFQAFLV